MTVTSCPSETVEAPLDIVWGLLTDPAEWSTFYDLRVIRIEPPGPASPGQRVFGESGPRWLHLGVVVTYKTIDASQCDLELDVQMPLGLAVREKLNCAPVSGQSCRVNYHCHFVLPSGWRGYLLRVVLARELRLGPADSLRRLKEAAEQRFRHLNTLVCSRASGV